MMTRTEDVDSSVFKFIFFGCWGVYCKNGEEVFKKLKIGKKITEETVEYGGFSASQATRRGGDNVYSKNPSDELVEEFERGILTEKELKNKLYDSFRKVLKNVLDIYNQNIFL